MKKAFVCVVVVLAFTGCMQSAKGPNGVVYKTVVEYNHYIVGRQLELIKNIKDMASYIGTNDSLALSMLSNISSKSLEYAKNIDGMPAWKENTNFRDKAVDMFKFYGTTYSDKFKELILLARNPETTVTERADLIDKGKGIDREEEKMNKVFLDAQKEFSVANKLRLEKRVDN